MRDFWPDALLFLSEALKAGLNVEAAVDLLCREAPSAFRSDLEKAWLENKWRPTRERIALLFSDPALGLAKAALLLSQETGGTVAPVLEKAAVLLKNKAELSEKIHTLTVQGKTSAWVVGLSPFFLAAGFSLFSPEYVAPLFTTKAGRWLSVLVVVMIAAGLYFVHRAARVEE